MTIRCLGALSLAVGLAGCPVTPEVQTGPGAQQGGPGGGSGPGGGGPGGGGPGGGGPGGGGLGGGPGEVVLNLDDMKGRLSQAEIKAGDHAVVSGSFDGACTGRLRIDVIDRTPGSAPRGPLSVANPPAAETFEVVVPTGTSVALSALCDNDDDGMIKGGGIDLASPGVDVGEVTEDVEGVKLVLSEAGPKGENMAGPPPGGEKGPPPDGAGGPPPGGGGEKGPPPGGAGGPPPGGGGGPPPGGGGEKGPPPGGGGGPPPGGGGEKGPPPGGAGGPPLDGSPPPPQE